VEGAGLGVAAGGVEAAGAVALVVLGAAAGAEGVVFGAALAGAGVLAAGFDAEDLLVAAAGAVAADGAGEGAGALEAEALGAGDALWLAAGADGAGKTTTELSGLCPSVPSVCESFPGDCTTMLGKAEKSFADCAFPGERPVRSKGFEAATAFGGNRIKAMRNTTRAKPLTATAIQRIFFERSDICEPLHFLIGSL